MFCKFCGSEIEDDSMFCCECGKRILLPKRRVGEKQVYVNLLKEMPIRGIIILVVGMLILCLVRYLLVGVTIVSKEVEAGSVVITENLVKTVSPNATIIINGGIDSNELGKKTITCNITNGIFKAKKKLKISVRDSKNPIISGESQMSIAVGDKFEPSNYYEVEDFEQGLKQKLEMKPQIDTSVEGKQEVELIASDSSGNVGKMDIIVKVVNLTLEKRAVLRALNQYIADGNNRKQVLDSAWVMKTEGGTNGVSYYVEIANNVLYAVYDSGKVKEYTISDCGGTTLHELLIFAVHYNGGTVNTKSF